MNTETSMPVQGKSPTVRKAQSSRLPHEVKRFIVEALACYHSPSQVVEEVGERFGMVISRQKAECYNPTRRAGKQLSAALRTLFEETRAKYLAQVESTVLAQECERMQAYDRLFRAAEARGDFDASVKILIQSGRDASNRENHQRWLWEKKVAEESTLFRYDSESVTSYLGNS